MIKKIIIVVLLLTIFYNILIIIIPINFDTSQNLWNENLIKAQRFYFDEKDYDYIFVGSSLSSKINLENLNNSFNLSFGGMGVLDGLNILKDKSKQPQYLLIEINYILRNKDQSLEKLFSSSLKLFLLNYIPSFRDEYQPLGVLGGLIKVAISKIEHYFSPDISPEKITDTIAFSEALKYQISINKDIPDRSLLEKRFLELKNIINFLEAKGVKVVFYEMPRNRKLYYLNYPESIRKKFLEVFPPQNYNYIFPESPESYITTDGLHLTEIESQNYTKNLLNSLDSLGINP